MFKIYYNNEKSVSCYTEETGGIIKILRNFVNNNSIVEIQKEIIMVATKDKQVIGVTGSEGIMTVDEPFDTIYVFEKNEITFDYNNKEELENFINNNDINIINPENNENSNIIIHRDNSPFIKDQPIPSQKTAENKIEEPTPSTVNVVPTTPISSVEPKKKSKAPLIIIILILLIGLGIAAYFLIPKTNNGNTNDSNSKKNSTNTKKEDKLKSNEVYYYDWDEDKNKIVTVPKEQKVQLVFYDNIDSGIYENKLDNKSKFGLYGIYFDFFKETKSDNSGELKFHIYDTTVIDGYVEIPEEIDGKKVEIIGGIKKYEELNEEKIKNIPIITEIKLPNSVELIKGRTFNYSLIKKIDLPDSVKVIGVAAFKKSINLKEVTLSKNLKVIASSAFEECTNLESVKTRGANKNYNIVLDCNFGVLEEIAYSSFHDCKELKSLAIINNTDDINHLHITLSNLIDDPVFNTLEEIYIEGYVDLHGRLSSDIPLKKLMLEDIENNHKMIDGDKKFILPLSIPENCEVEYFKLEK